MKSQIIKMDVDENTGEITETVEYVEVCLLYTSRCV